METTISSDMTVTTGRLHGAPETRPMKGNAPHVRAMTAAAPRRHTTLPPASPEPQLDGHQKAEERDYADDLGAHLDQPPNGSHGFSSLIWSHGRLAPCWTTVVKYPLA
jgi:hypothetical protein